MEYLDQDFQPESQTGLTTTREMRQDWQITARWAKFLSIVGFVMLGLAALYMLAIPTLVARLGAMGMEVTALEMLLSYGVWFGLFFLTGLGIQFMMNLFQLRFANNLKGALQFKDQHAFEQSWLNLRNLFRWIGILIIVSFVSSLLFSVVLYTGFLSGGLPF